MTIAGSLVVANQGTAFPEEPAATGGSTTVNRIYGSLDPAWGTPTGRNGETPILDPAQLKPWLNTVYGTVATPNGAAVPGADISLELLTPGGEAVQIATTVANEVGAYVLQLPITGMVLEAAAYGNGTVNFWLSAVHYEADGQGYSTYHGAGAIYSAMVGYEGGVGGLAMAPVNVGVLTVATVAAWAGAGLPETPGDDPEDPNTQPEPQRPELPAGLGETIAEVPVVSEPYVETPDVVTEGYVDLPDELPDPYDTPETEEDRQGDFKCNYPANQGRWHVDKEAKETKFQPIGEVHGWLGTKVKYTYTERANTVIGAAVNVEAKGWKVSGGSSVTNDSSAKMSLGYRDDYVAVPVEGEFVHVYQKRTWCPEGYDREHGPWALHDELIFTTGWTGSIRYGTRQLGGDGWDEYRKAAKEARAMTVYQDSTFRKTKGKTYKYTVGVSAFGVGLNAESRNDTKHSMTLKTTFRLQDWHAWGNKDVPASPANKAIYVSG